MGCCSGFARMILVILNIVFILCGFGILAGSIAVIVMMEADSSKFMEYLNKAIAALENVPGLSESGMTSTEALAYASYAGCALGAIVFIIAILGCCGACNDNKCCLLTYVVLVGIIFVGSLGAAISVFVFKDDIVEGIQKETKDKYYHPKNTQPGTEEDAIAAWYLSWSLLEFNMKCCGVTGKNDYGVGSMWLTKMGSDYPYSCGIDRKTAPVASSIDDTKGHAAYDAGCVDTLAEYALMFGGVVAGMCGLELIVIIMASCVACRSRDDEKY